MSAIKLTKNQTIRLTKNDNSLDKVLVGMGWRPQHSGSSWDLDQTLFCVDIGGYVVDEISYQNKQHNETFYYHGDDLTGGSGYGDKDDEQIDISLNKVDSRVKKIVVVMNIYCAYEKHQQLYDVKDCYIHLVNVNSKKELAIYPIENTQDFKGKTGMIVAEFARTENDEWEFSSIGEPVKVRDISELKRCVEKHYQSGSTDWKDVSSASNNSGSSKKGFFGRIFG